MDLVDLVPCEATFERLAVEDPARLLGWIREGTLAVLLTFAAEHAGTVRDSVSVRAVLVPLLAHDEEIVREGAILGLKKGHFDSSVRAIVAGMVEGDPSPDVREVAAGALND